MNGIFGSLFDYNGDGQLDWLEKATEMAFLQTIMEDDDAENTDEQKSKDESGNY